METNPTKNNISKENINFYNSNQNANSFLGDESIFIEQNTISGIIKDIEKEIPQIKETMETQEGRLVGYDKYKKTFSAGSEKDVSIGNIVSARRLGIQFTIPESIESSGDGKKIRKLMTESILNDHLYQKLNKELASSLSKTTKNDDALKAEAYNQIAIRSGVESKQFGVIAEQIIIGVLEGLSIDHSDLGFTILEANAYQDVNNKIDFIINTKQKKRGVGINKLESQFEEKSIGVQFTTNTSKSEHKMEQINKAKMRGVEVDDIIYVEINNNVLQDVFTKWEKSGKPLAGPWKYLSPEIKKSVFKNLFNGLLNEEQEKALQKIAEKN